MRCHRNISCVWLNISLVVNGIHLWKLWKTQHRERLWGPKETRFQFKWPWEIHRINSVADTAKCSTEKKTGKNQAHKDKKKIKFFYMLPHRQESLQWNKNYSRMTIKNSRDLQWTSQTPNRNARKGKGMLVRRTLRKSFSTQNW